ncbi:MULTISPECIES: NAD-dependent epimerase/dehydratase family protein [unclassified Streptomyces]|uniref:NAD-dependent epimerase/dehydratase family protein n=1 Tax=unclassified Streptomyces TaxID=2593676 RepID=UPI001F03EBDC|nr:MULTISPECIES: NAD-dependent epimerase/dehydratase family protein [unclassified Streptomyces]MCH0562403.1 NAD-dependent epimerase/dehydratase family protein [Streptomyces sp. MUM 2J]MCH0570509.1 NAD-dependent epimerase/dehydratase family protein [Streptomyces sp. MUM 136J]
MRVFVTGAAGHIASAVVPELIQAGHEVAGLARSDSSAAAVRALGAEVRRGDLADLDGLRQAAADADAVVHLAFDHAAIAAGRFGDAVAADLAAVRAVGEVLTGTGKAFVGVGLTPTGDARRDAAIDANPRSAVARAIHAYSEADVRTVLVAVPPVTHSTRDKAGFVPTLIRIARDTGVSGYAGDGANRWPAGHVLDVGRLYRLALEKAPAGSQLYAAAEEGVTVREIAETIGRHLDVPAVSIPTEQAADHFRGFPFITLDLTMPTEATRRLLGWEPLRPGLIADLDEGHYFTTG